MNDLMKTTKMTLAALAAGGVMLWGAGLMADPADPADIGELDQIIAEAEGGPAQADGLRQTPPPFNVAEAGTPDMPPGPPSAPGMMPGPGFGPGGGPGEGMRARMQDRMGGGQLEMLLSDETREKLKLTDDQVSKLKSLQTENEKQSIDLRAQIDKARVDLRSEMQSDTPNRDKIMSGIEAIGKLEIEQKKLQANQQLTVRETLTDEQRKELKEYTRSQMKAHRADRAQRMGNDRRGGKEGRAGKAGRGDFGFRERPFGGPQGGPAGQPPVPPPGGPAGTGTPPAPPAE